MRKQTFDEQQRVSTYRAENEYDDSIAQCYDNTVAKRDGALGCIKFPHSFSCSETVDFLLAAAPNAAYEPIVKNATTAAIECLRGAYNEQCSGQNRDIYQTSWRAMSAKGEQCLPCSKEEQPACQGVQANMAAYNNFLAAQTVYAGYGINMYEPYEQFLADTVSLDYVEFQTTVGGTTIDYATTESFSSLRALGPGPEPFLN